MATQYHQDGRLLCVRCSYEWMPRKEQLPKRCPKCRSVKWNESHLRVSCRRCGHEWNSHDGNPSRCPSCGSYKWNEPLNSFTCKRCGNSWTAKGGKVPRRCPGCYSRSWNREPEPEQDKKPEVGAEIESKIIDLYRAGKGCVDISISMGLPFGVVRGVIRDRTGAVPKA